MFEAIKVFLKNIDWYDLFFKTTATFWEAFIVVFVASDWTTMKMTGAAGAAAGLAAVKTFLSDYIRGR